MNKTPIEWTDYTWNPITGCMRGCSYCYARKMAHRFKRDFTPRLHPERLPEPAKLKKSSRIFVCSMSDLLGDGVQPKWIDEVWRAMIDVPQHTYQLLTKHPERYDITDPRPGVTMWLGATATDQESWDLACSQLSRLPSNVVRWISAEPLLSDIDLFSSEWRPDWVVVGALTGHGRRQQQASAIRCRVVGDELRRLGVPVFEKGSVAIGNEKLRREWPS